MNFVEPVTLAARGVELVPLALVHEEGLRAAAADGALWTLRVTSVPEPMQTRAYIETALAARQTGERFAFAVIDQASGTSSTPRAASVTGSTKFMRRASCFSGCCAA